MAHIKKSLATKPHRAAAAPLVCPRRDYKPRLEPAQLFDLPFMYAPCRGSYDVNMWFPPKIDDYTEACLVGAEWAAHFAQFLKDNPSDAGTNLIGHIAEAINYKDTSAVKGYWVGFFCHVERLILRAAKDIDVFDDIDEINARDRALIAKMMLEEEAEARS
jgi:hypothetical protein